MIEPTNYCNLKCPLCPAGQGLIKRKRENMSFSDFKKILDKMGDQIIHLRLWNWGEPLLNKELPKMIRYAKSKKIFVNTSVNGFFLDNRIIEELVRSGLDQLIVSLDGASEKTYNKYRKNGNFNKVISALKKASELKKRLNINHPEIKVHFIIMKHNEHEVKNMVKLARRIGVDTLYFKTVGVMHPSFKKVIKKYMPENPEFRRYASLDIKPLKLAGKVCKYLWKEITVNVDGSVVTCCRDAYGKYVFGNLKNENLDKIWNNQKMINFRKQILKNKNDIDVCKFCSGSDKEFCISEIHFH
jgi:radical SAM protein with 4Fe4S-binding SPASM domain